MSTKIKTAAKIYLLTLKMVVARVSLNIDPLQNKTGHLLRQYSGTNQVVLSILI